MAGREIATPAVLICPKLRDGIPAINPQVGSGDIAGGVGKQKNYRAHQILGVSSSTSEDQKRKGDAVHVPVGCPSVPEGSSLSIASSGLAFRPISFVSYPPAAVSTVPSAKDPDDFSRGEM